jgi:hypothetical protein
MTERRKAAWSGTDWIELAQNRDRCRALLDTVLNPRVQWDAGKFLSSRTPAEAG